jgi:signal transduction histidine kinase
MVLRCIDPNASIHTGTMLYDLAMGPCLAECGTIFEEYAVSSFLNAQDGAREDRFVAASAFIAHLQLSTERDKTDLARALHDELGAIIVAAIMDVAWAETHFDSCEPDARQRLSRVRQLLGVAMDKERKMIEQLRPTLLDNVGLFAALHWQLKNTWGRAGLESTENYPETEISFRPDVLIALFRIAQEALEISLIHESVKSAALRVKVEHDTLTMRFSDDGKMATAPRRQKKRGGLPLTSMRYRLRALGGRVRITTPISGGTVLLATVPLIASLSCVPVLTRSSAIAAWMQ